MSNLNVMLSLRVSLLGLCLVAVLSTQPATAFAAEKEEMVTVTVRSGRYARTRDPGCIGEKTRDPSARCKELCAFLPERTKIVAVEIFMKEAKARKWIKSRANAQSIASAKFVGDYTVERVSNEKRVCWLFKNWSRTSVRQARMVVRYR